VDENDLPFVLSPWIDLSGSPKFNKLAIFTNTNYCCNW